jgi:type IV pilus assembly protein PilY1
MFKAESSSGAVQPITTAPVYQAHPDNGWMIVFGTGQNFTVTDRSDTTVQSFYGLYDFGYKLDADPAKAYIAGGVKIMAPADNTKNSWSLPGRRTTAMKQQTASAGNSRTSANLPAAQVSQMGSVYRGWYLDLPEARERVLRNPMWYDGDLLDLLSDVPAVAATSNDPCQAVNTSAARYFITTLNAVSGNAPNTSVWGKGDLQNRKESDLPILPTRDPGNGTQPTTCVGPDCKDPKPRERNLLGRYFKTPSWRQLQ